nr:leucyl aminopeptidase [Sporomusaceae bacterium]
TVISHAVEGLILGSYSFDQYKAKKESTTVKTCSFVGGEEPADFSQIVERGLILSENVKLVRQLVNEPAAVMTPSAMEAKAKAIAKKCGLVFDCLGRKQLEEQKMNAFLAVAQGSEEKPKLLVLEYKGNPDHSECIALIGKGITFDSGGLSLKPSSGMEEMKDDMGGAATVLGTIKALAELKVKINVMAIMPCTENMPSGSAYRPGDIITAMSGKTIEVVNTDAEGRLILADAITYAKEKGATKLIDVATLTGACVVALGAVAAGVFTNKQEWGQKLLDASEETGEKMWQLPLFKEYEDLIKSQVADIKNSGGREAGASTAACFLQHFAGDTPWIHIDIAGVVTTKKNQGYQVKGATGAGVFTLVKLFESLSHE